MMHEAGQQLSAVISALSSQPLPEAAERWLGHLRRFVAQSPAPGTEAGSLLQLVRAHQRAARDASAAFPPAGAVGAAAAAPPRL